MFECSDYTWWLQNKVYVVLQPLPKPLFFIYFPSAEANGEIFSQKRESADALEAVLYGEERKGTPWSLPEDTTSGDHKAREDLVSFPL